LDINIVSSERYNLEKMSRYLNYELSTAVFYFLSYAWGFTLLLAIIAATLFTPFLLFVLFKEKKIAWLISFFISVIIPLIICIILGVIYGHLAAFILVPLGFFYLFCFVFKYSVNDRLAELKAREDLNRKREERRLEKEIWQRQIEIK